MAEGGFDFAICGSTPFAGLVAGFLASAHGKRVCLVGDGWSPYRLARGIDVSVTPATRPETLVMLKRTSAESLKLIGGIGKGLYERVDPLFIAETPASADMLGHMRWLALGLGLAAERVVDRAVSASGTLFRIRDAAMLVPGKAEPAIDAWLAAHGIRRLPPGETSVAFHRDGSATLSFGQHNVEAATVVLADDEAILRVLPQVDRHRLLLAGSATSVLTEPAKPLGAALIHYLDREVTLQQRGSKGGPITALAWADVESAGARIGASLGAERETKRIGQTSFPAVSVADGAPLVGRLGKSRAFVAAGLGAGAAFLAPAIARLLAGAATEEEDAYFAPREPAKAASRQSVADFTRLAEQQPAAEPEPQT